jgi:ankyrin repeat protein
MRLKSVFLAWFGAALCAIAQVPGTALLKAVFQNDTVAAEKLLAEGADPNEGSFAGIPPIFFPVIHQNLRLFRALKEKGADIRAKDKTGSNLLMWAAFDDSGRPELVEELLRLGLNPADTDSKGDDALTWALRRGSDTPAVRALRKAGASSAPMILRAAENALALLQKSGPQFTKVSGCASCHHQSLPQMANGIARTRGVRIDEQVAQQQVKAVIATFSPLREEMMRGIVRFPDVPISVSYTLLGLASEGYPADETTAAMAHLIGLQQLADGSFRTIPARPPLESSDFTATSLSLRALQLYGETEADRIQRAAAWLQTTEPRNLEDRAMQLLGMKWANTDVNLLKKRADRLLSMQQGDGGWSQLPTLGSDAYATGQALVALERSGTISALDSAYQRGVDFLLRTQLADGSWLVHSRSFPVQPYKESGYPHGPDQWISASGSSWAAMALALAAPVPQKGSRSFTAF